MGDNFSRPRSVTGTSLSKEINLLHDSDFFKEMKAASIAMDTHIHFGIIYSNPLVSLESDKNGNAFLSSGDPVDFAGECSTILESFREHQKHLNVHI